jgi:phosphoribosylanthranilate isomerase
MPSKEHKDVGESPYIGVTGLTTLNEVTSTLKYFNAARYKGCLHVPMLGFLVSYKCLEYGFNPGDRKHPKLRDLSALLSEAKKDTNAFVTIHYYTKNTSQLYEEISKVLKLNDIYERELCDGVQLNSVWPPKEEVLKIKENFPRLKIILQLPGGATNGMSAQQVSNKVKNDYPYVEHVLIDPSGGKGQPFDINRSTEIYNALKSTGFNGNVGFAGGLCGENVGAIISMLPSTGISIDAEGGLRDKLSDESGDSVLNLEKVKTYVTNAYVSMRKRHAVRQIY